MTPLMTAIEKTDNLGEWVRGNAWHLITTAALIFLMAGQWQERQSGAIADVRDIKTRVQAIEAWQTAERGRLDPIYLAREVSIAQNAEILRRLDVIERELQQVRRAQQ